MSGLAWLGFVAAASAGAVLRYLIDWLVGPRKEGQIPWATLTINFTGSTVLGLLTGLALYHAFPTTPRVILGTGFCGAYTTFSTFSFETVHLVEERAMAQAVRYAATTMITCALGAAAGLALATL